MKSKNGGSIFAEEKTLKFLTKKTRVKLINHVHCFCLESVSPNPSKEQLVELCQALIALFPSLKQENSGFGGIVSTVQVYFEYLNA